MVPAELTRGHIFDIQGFSVHDGPGCRTLIFFKGCTLDCDWCSNPEGKSFLPEPLYRESKCIFDNLCVDACSLKAISVFNNGDAETLVFDRKLCEQCRSYDCVKSCNSGALNIGGYEISVEDLYATINRDRQYWGENGGITLTGGEPFAQPVFAGRLLKRCYDAGIHTAVETCGNVPWENYKYALPSIDWIFFDLKTVNRSVIRHPSIAQARQPGISPVNRILENARRIAGEFSGRLIFRLPVIPGFNDDPGNIRETARFIQSTGRTEVNILPLHHLGREKYALLGKAYFTSGFKIPGKKELDSIAAVFTASGITCYTGSDTPF